MSSPTVNSKTSSHFNPDFKELLQVFADQDVEYLVFGGYAVIHHAQPRSTKDPDLWVKPSAANARRVAKAFARFGIPLNEVTEEDLANPGLQYMVGVEPCAIDFLTSLPGVDFDEAWARRVDDCSLGFMVHFVGLDDLMTAKRTAGRFTDLADLEELERAKRLAP